MRKNRIGGNQRVYITIEKYRHDINLNNGNLSYMFHFPKKRYKVISRKSIGYWIEQNKI
jgi:hypothetical protein